MNHPKIRVNNYPYPILISCKKGIFSLIFLLIFSNFFSICYSQGHPATDDEFVGPFPSWINVKTQFGAVGDGVADETAALQAAFNAVGNSGSTASVVYLPPGTYRITGTLTMNYKISISIIGADPATTKIIWGGAAAGIMMQIYCTAYSRFNRISWDGKGIASIAVDQSHDGVHDHFDTGNEYADDIFSNVGIGIRGGILGYGFAETAIMRCKFINNSSAGISLANFNALDCWVWYSIFENCAIGITNNITTNSKSGAGNFKVYNSIFRSSSISDIVIGNTGEFSFRDNTSTNSQAFLKVTAKDYPSNITLQSNTIIDPVSSRAIDIQNQGPIILLDNIIRSRIGAVAPVVYHSTAITTSDFFSMGNTFTVANPIQATGKKIIYDKSVVTVNSLSALGEPTLPGTQPNLNRTVFEVPIGSDANIIQTIIDQANLLIGTRPIVHLPYGTYNIQSTLNIPANSDLQIVGDGDGDNGATWLLWTGGTAGPVINILGPSKVTLRDFSINGNGIVSNISLSNIDQNNSRIFMHEAEVHSNQTNLFVNGLDNTLILANNSRFSTSSFKSINIIGGVLAANDNPQQGRTIIYGGLEFNNNLSHEVTNGGNLLIRDLWYESVQDGPYLSLPGLATCTIEGSRIASPRNSVKPEISLSNFNGRATLINTFIGDTVSITGNGTQTKFLGLGVQFGDYTLPVQSSAFSYINNSTSPAGDIRSFNCRANDDPNIIFFPRSGSYSVNDIGPADSIFIASMLSTVRSTHAQTIISSPNGVTDVRFYRVWIYNGIKGIELKGLLPSQASLYFRSKQNGNWNDINTWESSSDSSAWTAAAITPDYNANSITVRNGHAVTVTADVIIDQTFVNPTGSLVVTGSTLTVTNTLSANGLTLQSNVMGTARIGTSTGIINGNITAERYISDKRAWRLLGVPFSSSIQTIKSSWMEGGSTASDYGTQITTFSGDGNAVNFDAIKPSSSIRIYSGNNFNSDAAHTPNTINLITHDAAYFLFVRGNRSIDLNNTTAHSATTLRVTGTVNAGSVTKGVTGTNFSLIPNPYLSPIDFDAVKTLNQTISKFYVWDASMGSVGQYRTIDITGTAPNYIYTATPGTTSNNWRFIESGTAFFIPGSAQVNFTEATKSSGIPPSSMLRTPSVNQAELAVNLYSVNTDNAISLADGVKEIFDNSYSAAIDNDDAKKIAGFDRNLGIVSSNEIVAIEKRPFPNANDVILLSLSNIPKGNYQFELQPANFAATALLAYLKDNYLNTLSLLV